MSIINAVPRILARFGRPVTLRRRQAMTTTFTEVTANGYLRQFSPEEIAGGVMNGDARLIIDAEPLQAMAPPVKGDFVLIDGRNWAVLGAHARMTSDNLTSYELWVRGG